MIKFNRKNKTLAIPIGINPNYGIDSSMLYDISDADIVASDVIEGKIGYGKDGKIVGTLDIESEKEESYNEGIEAGKVEVIEGMNDATITAGTVVKGYIGYGKDGERIVGEQQGFDFSDIGYNQTDNNSVNDMLLNYMNYSYTKNLYDRWNPNNTSAVNLYMNRPNIHLAPRIDLSNVISVSGMFNNCYDLKYVPTLNTKKCENFYQMFYNCSELLYIEEIDTTSATTFEYMFANTSKLDSIPPLESSNVTNMSYMFYYSGVQTIPLLDCSSITHINSFAFYARSITNVGGFLNLGKGYTGTGNFGKDLVLAQSSDLTYQSCMNIFNTIYDMNLNTQNTYIPRIMLHATAKALLSDEDIAIATSKGWTVQAG